MIQRICILLFPLIFFFKNSSQAQDQLFLRNGDGILDCYILSVSDSIILFRTLDPTDKHEYEIPYADTYGYLLEDAGRLQSAQDNASNFQLIFSHEKSKRHPKFSINRGLLFRLKNDTTLLPRRGRITSISADSIQLEMKRKHVLERVSFALNDIEMFGYTTKWTELATLIVIPASSVKEGSLQFYRKLLISKGWKWEVKSIAEHETRSLRGKRKFKPGQLLKLPKSVKKKSLRDK